MTLVFASPSTFRPMMIGLLCLAITVVAARRGCGQVATDKTAEPSLANGLALLAERNYQAAAEVLADVVAAKQAAIPKLVADPNLRSQAASEIQQLQQGMIGAGTALRQLGRQAEALEFFDAAVQLSITHDAAFVTSQKQINAIKLAAAECAAGAGKHDQAISYCEGVINELETTTQPTEMLATESQSLLTAARQTLIRSALAIKNPKQAWEHFEKAVALDSVDKRAWQELALSIGLAALSGNEPAVAQIAFRWYLKHAVEFSPENPIDRETAILGIAWAAAQGAEPYEVAARRLLDFVEQYPQHAQASKALLAAGGCFERCGCPNEAADAYDQIVSKYPQSPQVATATANLFRLRPTTELNPALVGTLKQAVAQIRLIPTAMMEAVATAAATDQDEELWIKLLDSIESQPQCGAQVARTLHRLDQAGYKSHAERLAAYILDSAKIRQSIQQPHAAESCPVEQTCRWAALRGHWGMLASAGKELVSQDDFRQLGVLSLRLMAEGSMQSADLETAKVLLDQLISGRDNQDFDTWLRRAEIAISLESKEQAAQWIDAAEGRATTAIEKALANVLKAQWFIRDARMIDARDVLERVIRDFEVSDEIKARARWLMGETYYLQRQFAEAVNHYRLVEPLDQTGHWTAAALVQAGRCFEELGRNREAAVCYTGLMTRFGDSAHLPIAQQRLAALGGPFTGGDKAGGDPNSNGGSNPNTKLR